MALTVQRLVSAPEVFLEVISGESHLQRVIPEPSVNRPGLALAGFFQYFANKRIQVLGLAELTYLKSLSPKERLGRLATFFEKHVPVVVVTRNRHAPGEVLELAKEYRVPVVRSPRITMDFINGVTVIMQDLVSPRDRVHGTMVDLLGIGVLIEGAAGIGKSEAALALIKRGHSLVADDITVLNRDRSGDIVGTSVDITKYHMEIRGIGMIHVPSLFGVAAMRFRKNLDLIVHLRAMGKGESLDRLGLSPEHREIFGVPIPLITIPVAPGRDLSLLIETAAMSQKLKLMGHDAGKEFDQKLIKTLSEKSASSSI